MNSEIHRLLDEAFAGIELTPDVQDLKEEIRANLLARVAELEAAGLSPRDAAGRALGELGDIRDLMDPEVTKGAAEAMSSAVTPSRAIGWVGAARSNRVRPKPAFVVRTVLLSVVAAAALAVTVIAMTPLASWPELGTALALGFGTLAAALLGVVTADSLTQETTTNHPLPTGRAASFGAAAFAGIAALAWCAVFVRGAAANPHRDAVWIVVVAAVWLVISVTLFAWLGATKTNRHKAWTRRMVGAMPPNRFEDEPGVAERFGIYTGVIWLVAIVVGIALGLTIGWPWAPLALVGGLAATMLLLGRMMFSPRRQRASPPPEGARRP